MGKLSSNHGGRREGAGRPKGSGKYKEPTKAIRVPEGSLRFIKDYLKNYPELTLTSGNSNTISKLEIPVFSSKVAAGLPSYAEDHIEDTLDLNDYMVQRPDSTFMLRKIIIAAIDGELTVKRLYHRGELVKLLPENPAYPEIELESENDLVIWGVVVGSFRRFQTF